MKSIVKVKNLNVTYFLGMPNEIRALNNINLDIYPGEFVIFFGPSGCGKSTLLYSIAGLETNINGKIYIQDENIADIDFKELERLHQKKIGMIFQAYYLINSLSVFKNIVLPQIAIGANKKEREERVLKLLEHFGVKQQSNKLPNELSGGQQQRVAICRALINDPEILLADEPVGNLDSRSADDVMKLLKNLNEKNKKTIILVTHNPAHLNMAHRVFYIKDGVIIKTTVNSSVNQIKPVSVQDEKPSISKELELLARTFSSISGSTGNLLLPFKAKQIVSEALTGMTSEEIGNIERRVEKLLTLGVEDNNNMSQYLDDSIKKGGLGMDKRVAEKITKFVKNIIKEIKLLVDEENKHYLNKNFDSDKNIAQIRHYLFETFNVNIENITILELINTAIQDRLANTIDKNAFQKILDLPIKQGGAGMDYRVARKVSKRLELLILGKYK